MSKNNRGKYSKKPKIFQRGKKLWIDYTYQGQRVRYSLKLNADSEGYLKAKEYAFELSIKIQQGEEIYKDKKRKIVFDKLRDIEDHLLGGSLPKHMTTKLDTSYKIFIDSHDFSDKNKNQYDVSYKQFFDLVGDIQLRNINEKHYMKYKEWLLDNKSHATAVTRINYMHIFFNFLIETEYYKQKNPFVKLKKRHKQKIRTVSDDHLKLIYKKLESENKELYNFIKFLRLTGFRKEEALQLTWNDVHFKKNVIVVTTNKDNEREDLFPLNLNGAELKTLLSQMYKEKTDEKLFHLTSNWILKPFQNLITDINNEQKKNDNQFVEIPKYTLHDFRRTFGSEWARKVTQIELMKLMRHRNIDTTLKYYIDIDITNIGNKQK